MKREFVFYSFLFVCYGFVNNIGTASAQSFQWAKAFNGTTYGPISRSIAVDDSGNVYTTGYFYGTVDFDPGLGYFYLSAGTSASGFISKLNSTGDFVWAKLLGSTGTSAYCMAIDIDSSGNVLTSGYFVGTIDFDPGVSLFNIASLGAEDIFILKLSSSGNFIWAKSMGGTGNDYGYSIKLDSHNNIFTTGSFFDSGDFDPGPGNFNLISNGGGDVFVSKLDSMGNFIWAKAMGGSNTQADFGNSIAVDSAGNVISTGIFRDIADFDPNLGVYNLSSSGMQDLFISKLDGNGNFVWAKSIGAFYNDVGNAIVVDSSGNVYTTGTFYGTVDFDPGAGTYNLSNLGNDNIFVLKLTASGNFVWAKAFYGSSFDSGNSIALDGLRNVYTCGYFHGTTDFDPGAGNYSYANLSLGSWTDLFISKLDSMGQFKWASRIGGIGQEIAYDIAVDDSGNVFTTGFFNDTADFNPGIGVFQMNANTGTAFVQKMGQCAGMPATPELISGNTIVCNGTTNTYSIASISGSTSYTWTLPIGWTGSSITSSISTLAGTSSGTIMVTSNNGACSSTEQLLQVVNGVPPTPGNILGDSTLCTGVSATFGILTVPGALSYSWTLPSGWTGFSTSDTIICLGTVPGGSVAVSANNSCGTSIPQFKNVNVNPMPTVPTITEPTSGTLHSSAALGIQWYKNSVLNAGATSQDYVYTTSGTYTVRTTVSGCSSLSSGYDATILGIGRDSNQNEWNISIYPNPVSDEIWFSSNRIFESSQIIDLTGRIVCSNPGLDHIQLPKLAPGFYFVHVSDGHEIKSLKIVVM